MRQSRCSLASASRTLGDVASYAQMVELSLVGAQTGFDVAQTLAVSQLCESHAQKLIEMRKSLGGIFGGVALHTATECNASQKPDSLLSSLSPEDTFIF